MNENEDHHGAPHVPLPELFVALTSRWRREDGSLAFGISEADLLAKGEITLRQWKELQHELRARIEPLGIEVVKYDYLGHTWWCCRSLYPVPPELDEDEMLFLATFLYAAGRGKKTPPKHPRAKVDALGSLLIDGGYVSKYAFDRTLRQLQDKAYVRRSRSFVEAESRLLLEIPEENRAYLAEQVERLVV